MGRPPRSVDFFRVWTPEMAYILGYWWADGCMRIKADTGAHLIAIAGNDRAHLETMAQAINVNYYMRKVSLSSQCYEISYCSKEMFEDLQAHGGTPHKSRTIGFPSVPPELLPHFVRGFVDGDGTLSWNAGKPILQIYSASRPLLDDMAMAIERVIGIPAPNLSANRENAYIKWSTVRAKCLAAWLYFDNIGLALEQKVAVAAQFLEWQPKKKPERGTITDEMRMNFSAYLPL